MAATRDRVAQNKGKSVAACLKSRTDYVQNPDKTEHGELISSYECNPLTVDEEFMLSNGSMNLSLGADKSDVIAYQIRQSFKPGEITAEEANKVGYELAMRFTKGKYAFIVATHTDREHIHNHIIYNSTALDSTRKFRDFLLSGLAVQRLSDLICLEHQLSVIEIKPYRERQKRTLYPPRESNRDKLCAVIDNILLNEKPASFEGFLQKLEQQGYEIKRGKHASVKGARQKRFIRFRTLGAGYSEDEIKAVIAGEAEHRPHQKQPPKSSRSTYWWTFRKTLRGQKRGLCTVGETLQFERDVQDPDFCRKIKSAALKKCRNVWMQQLLTITNWAIPLKPLRSGWQKLQC